MTDREDMNTKYVLKDYGPQPLVINIAKASKQNDTFRTALWTGHHLQVTLMSINVGEEIGTEIHSQLNQFLRIEQGQGLTKMGYRRNDLNMQASVTNGDAILVRAGAWHSLINTSNIPLKLYSIYAPPQHPHGTVYRTKTDAMSSLTAGLIMKKYSHFNHWRRYFLHVSSINVKSGKTKFKHNMIIS